ncbi:hypothetical protein [Ectobacillus ponti]|uniref:Uncharacterized protein n=1 Tax=Ectobacillus ponti TaxID=2961894 RepID=A0AA42BNS0_9BACI|nr:hypothetical protein [Ectobacillus ponti]MCP8967661.1 hypothetical protein [Ectobacillus ponti]
MRDERLALQTLKSIRLAFFVQTAGTISLLGYETVTKGAAALAKSPLLALLSVTVLVFTLHTLRVSTALVEDAGMTKFLFSYARIILTALLIGGIFAGVGLFAAPAGQALGAGGIVAACFFLFAAGARWMRKKYREELEDE